MKKTASLCLWVATLLTTGLTYAGVDHQLIQSAEKNIVTVAQAKKLSDETPVLLNGTLLKHVNQDYYEFQDRSGIILLDLDDDLLRDANVKIGDPIRIWGEIDTHRYKPTDIEVEKIEKIAKLAPTP